MMLRKRLAAKRAARSANFFCSEKELKAGRVDKKTEGSGAESVNHAVSLYVGHVVHQRFFPVQYRFKYRVFSFLLDIDRLDSLEKSPLVSLNRFNLFGVQVRDHGARDANSWREWINPLLHKHNLAAASHRVRLLCFPRILGYAFNPLSAWFCYDHRDQLLAVIHEVSNTFGECHHYVLHQDGEPLELPFRASKKKIFHVSPFISMDQQYHFVVEPPGERLRLVINEYEQDRLMLFASQSARQQPFTTPRLLSLFFLIPLMTLKIMVMIHWHALRIWMKGGKFYRKPEQSAQRIS